MNLDIRTILVLLSLSALLMTLTLWLGTGESRGGGIGKWSGGLAALALGWLLVAARGAISPLASVALAGALLLAGLSLHVAALREFEDERAPRLLQYLPAAALFVVLAPLAHDFLAVTTIVSLAGAAVLGASAVLALTRRTAAAGVRRAMAAAYALGAVALVFRLATVWSVPEEVPEIFAEHFVQTLTFTVLFCMMIVVSLGFLVMQRDRAESAARRLAMFDGLTQLLNRQAFLELARRELARAARANERYAVLMMDIDHFKRVNDTYGHLAGDRVLAAFADIARRSLRREDIVGRYGGEEFCALLPGMDIDAGTAAAERIRAALAAQPLAGLPTRVTVSIGVTAAQGSADVQRLLACSDDALYRAKGAGRNGVVALPLARLVAGAAAPGAPRRA